MTVRRLPVRPDLEQLRRQAKELLRALRAGDPAAREELARHHPRPLEPAQSRLADAQLVLARSLDAPSWPRLVQACRLVEAIWRDDPEAVRELVRQNPALLHEPVLIRRDSNWGPPLSYAANLGRDRILALLHELGATDLEPALARAVLQGRIESARMLHTRLGRPLPAAGALAGPAYTLNVPGTAFLFEIGARVHDASGRLLVSPDVVLETDSRHPSAKHRILELYVEHGLALPDTPPMAVHRGRLDLLEEHLRRDPRMLSRTFTHEEIYPPELGCHDEVLATHGTPLAGASLLHLCIDYDEFEIAEWLLERGMDVDLRAIVDGDGFGGHTALFATVVSQPNFWSNLARKAFEARFTRLLLQRGADPNARASLRKQLHPGYGPDTLHEYRDVTPLAWGRNFHDQRFVSEPALRRIAEHGGA